MTNSQKIYELTKKIADIQKDIANPKFGCNLYDEKDITIAEIKADILALREFPAENQFKPDIFRYIHT